jgi:BTB/POZ domain-containing protein KCTD9
VRDKVPSSYNCARLSTQPLPFMITRRQILFAPLVLTSAQVFGASMRLTYAESCRELQKAGHLEQGPVPPIPNHLPRHDDPEPLGVNFFRTRLENDRLENMTLQRTFFARSEIVGVSFRNTDLSQSNLCWNDFTDVDFSNASLESSDLRASTFSKVRFNHANLAKADLRRSTFEGCTFDDAILAGAIAHHRQKTELKLAQIQIQQMAWTHDDGEEPGGG